MKNKQSELQEQWELLSERIKRLRKAHVIETDPSVQFKLEKEIEGLEQERKQIERELESLVSPKTICFDLIDYTTYLERLESYVLESFRQDHYVMLTVESLDSEDADTLTAVQEALRSTFDIHVETDLRGGGKKESLEKAIEHHRLVALLGDPGIGKTTSLRFVTLQHIQQVLENNTQIIPIWVSLGKWGDKNLLAEEFIWQEFLELFDGQGVDFSTFKTHLAEGKFLVLLDGLNELPQRELEKRGASLSHHDMSKKDTSEELFDPRENSLLILAKDSRSRFILSCRILEYADLPGWREFRILPFNDKQIRDFIHRQLEQQSQQFEKILADQPQLCPLMQNPFYLRSLVSLVQNHWQENPTDRFELVEYTCRAALYRETKKQELEINALINLIGEDSLWAMEGGWIGSWFNRVLKLDVDNVEHEKTSKPPLLEAMKCAEGAGLLIRTKESLEEVWYRYFHQLVQESLVLMYLKNEKFKNEEYPKAQSLAEVGKIHLDWRKLKEAQENLQRALELCPTVGADELRASILFNLSRVYRVWREPKKGLEYAKNALQALEDGDATIQLAEIYHELAKLNESLHRIKLAKKNYHLALKVYERLKDKSKYAYEILYGLARLYQDLYRIPKAITLYKEARNIFKSQEDDLGVLRTELEMAFAHREWGEVYKADELCDACIKNAKELENLWIQLWALVYQGYICIDTKRFSKAEKNFKEAINIAKQKHWQINQFTILLYGFSHVFSYQGKYARAEEILDEARILAEEQIDKSFIMNFYLDGRAHACWLAGDFQKCAEVLLKWWNSIADEEARINLKMVHYLWLKWAKYVGIHSNSSILLRVSSEMLLIMYKLIWRIATPSHWLGRQLYRAYRFMGKLTF